MSWFIQACHWLKLWLSVNIKANQCLNYLLDIRIYPKKWGKICFCCFFELSFVLLVSATKNVLMILNFFLYCSNVLVIYLCQAGSKSIVITSKCSFPFLADFTLKYKQIFILLFPKYQTQVLVILKLMSKPFLLLDTPSDSCACLWVSANLGWTLFLVNSC